jgi:signal transduction histidine kinase
VRLGTKIMLGFVIMLSLTFGVGGSLLISASFDDSLSRAINAAVGAHKLMLYTLAAVGGTAPQTSGSEEIIKALEQLDTQGGKSWAATRLVSGGDVLYQSQEPAAFEAEIPAEADASHLTVQVSRSDGGAHYLRLTGQLQAGGGSLYLTSIFDISPVYEARNVQQAIYSRVFISVIVIGAAVSWLLSLWLTKPLRKLSSVTRIIAGGDLSCRAETGGKDEIGTLAADFNNMTDRLEEKMTELTDAMHRQEEFMGGFAHELKTPMTSIIGYADLLRSHELSDRDRREAANYVFTEGRRLEKLSLKLLELIVLKREDFELAPVSVAHIIADIARLVKPVILQKGIVIRHKCDAGLSMVEPDLVKSLILNLVDNARKALDTGGEIYIELKVLPDGCVLRVADNGRGMPEAELTKITDAFYRVDKSRSRAQGGVGLGLALCREIAAIHHGSISFESAVGVGTAVTATLKGGPVS